MTQVNLSEFKANLDYRASSRTASPQHPTTTTSLEKTKNPNQIKTKGKEVWDVEQSEGGRGWVGAIKYGV